MEAEADVRLFSEESPEFRRSSRSFGDFTSFNVSVYSAA